MSESMKSIREKAKAYTIPDVRALARAWAKVMTVWLVAAISVGLFTFLFRILDFWLAVIMSIVLFILAGIGNLALIGLPYISPKKKSPDGTKRSE